MIKIALIGNPNVGKSTLFNELTGMHQHTGNWTGKTVGATVGYYKDLEIYDLPGTYSLIPHSKEEEVTSSFLLNEKYDIAVVVCDANMLERNLNLVLQTLEVTNKVILCVNLIEVAQKNNIKINFKELENILNVKVIPMSVRLKIGIQELIDSIYNFDIKDTFKIEYNEKIEECIKILDNNRYKAIYSLITLNNNQAKLCKSYLEDYNINLDEIPIKIVKTSEEITNKVITFQKQNYFKSNLKIDKILTNKITGIPIMISLLVLIFYISIKGANYPSDLLFKLFNCIGKHFKDLLINIHIPSIIYNPLIDGIYKVLTWVIAVMLPPMLIFFPLFTFLEDLGILPRIAFNLDGYLRKSNACGKQALTMMMGFGCNAVGVEGTRIIDSKRERLIAILTNSFVPCNGRFPTIITILTIFFIGAANPFLNILLLTFIILLGIIVTLIVSKILSHTLLKGYPSFFILELPPYRRPQIIKIIINSIFNRTLFVLGRAVIIAIPSGLIIWLLANISINNICIINHLSNFLNNFGILLGMDGVIILAFILGFPANEIVMPIMIMIYTSNNSLIDITNINVLKNVLINNHWTFITAISVLIFTLFHFPCSTTLLTIKKETNSIKWTILSIIIPFIIGIILCIIISNTLKLLI